MNDKKTLNSTINYMKNKKKLYNKKINNLREEKDALLKKYKLIPKVLMWSIPMSFVLNVLICLSTHRVIGFTSGYVLALPICLTAFGSRLLLKIGDYQKRIVNMDNYIEKNEDKINEMQQTLDKILDGTIKEETKQKEINYIEQKENTTTNENTNQKVQVSDDFIKYYEKYFMNNGNNTRNQGPTRTLKR